MQYVEFDGLHGALVTDVSEAGLGVISAVPMQNNQRVQCRVELGGSYVEADAVIVNPDPTGRAGVRFVAMSDSDRQKLKVWLLEHALASAAEQVQAIEPIPDNGMIKVFEARRPPIPIRPEPNRATAVQVETQPAPPAHSIALSELPADADRALELVVRRAREWTIADGAAIALSRDGVIRCRARAGEIAPDIGAPLDTGSSFSGQCIRLGTTLVCNDSEHDGRVDAEVCRQIGIRSIVACPVCRQKTVIGVVEVFSSLAHAFGDAHVADIERLAELVSQIDTRERGEALAAAPVAPVVSMPPPPPVIPEPRVERVAPPAEPAPAIEVAPKVVLAPAPVPVAPPSPPAPPVAAAPVEPPPPPASLTPPAPPARAAVPPAPPLPPASRPVAAAAAAPAPARSQPPSSAPPPPVEPRRSEKARTSPPAARPPDRYEAPRKPTLPTPPPPARVPGTISRPLSPGVPVATQAPAPPVVPIAASVVPETHVGLATRSTDIALATTTPSSPVPIFLEVTEAQAAERKKARYRNIAIASAIAIVLASGAYMGWRAVVASSTAQAQPAIQDPSAAAAGSAQPLAAVPVSANTAVTGAPPASAKSDSSVNPAAAAPKPSPKHEAVPEPVELRASAPGSQRPAVQEVAPPPVAASADPSALARVVIPAIGSPAVPIRTSGVVRQGRLISQVQPIYPAAARQLGVGGVVQLTLEISPEGRVTSVQRRGGPPMLIEAAVQAARQWRYEPTTLDGKPVATSAEVTINFNIRR